MGLWALVSTGCLNSPIPFEGSFSDASQYEGVTLPDARTVGASDASAPGRLDASVPDTGQAVSDAGDAGTRDAAAEWTPDAQVTSDAAAEDVSVSWENVAPVRTDFLCVLAGTGSTPAPGQAELRFRGTDLGFSYAHEGRLHWLFGDSWSGALVTPIDPSTPNDDVFASQSLEDYPDGDAVEQACASPAGLPLELGTYADGSLATFRAGHALDGFKTPLGGFSTGSGEVGLFFTGKPLGCASDDDCMGLVCDTGLGFWGEEYFAEEGVTRACVDGASIDCLASTMADENGLPRRDTGLCVDPGASVAAETDAGRIRSVATMLRVGSRAEQPHRYETVPWLTTRFMNPVVTTARSLSSQVPPVDHDYTPHAGAQAMQDTVWVFGRPHFVGVGALGQSLHMYLARTPMPQVEAQGRLAWSLEYFTHLDAQGVPQFSRRERDAVALDLSGPDDPRDEIVDLVNQVSVRWVPELGRWLMLYGGGTTTLPNPLGPDCGVLQHFVGSACDDVQLGRGAVYMRTARHPWGPWSAPVEVLAGGDPEDPTLAPTQYGPGGLLRHPSCTDESCAPHDTLTTFSPAEYGFLYGANLVPQWTEVRDDGVDLYWNASSWDPYRVVLLKTHVRGEP